MQDIKENYLKIFYLNSFHQIYKYLKSEKKSQYNLARDIQVLDG